MAACMMLSVVGYAFYRMPVDYVCMDINPSIEIGINAFGKVVSVEAYNEDGLKVIGKNKYFNQSVKDTVAALVKGAAEEGFIDEDGGSVIALTAESENEEVAAELQKAVGGCLGGFEENEASASFMRLLDLNSGMKRRNWHFSRKPN